MLTRDIVVVGASAGGVNVLMTLARSLPPDFPAALFIVMHLPSQAESLLPTLLNRAGPLPALHPGTPQAIKPGVIYVAPPDHHLLLEEGRVLLVRGPKENRHRPAVDPLFRSAAVAYGPRVVGVVLTGSLDDGTAGLLAIKRRGGLAIVQDPDEALFPSMPTNALAQVEVDHILPIAAIGPLLVQLADTPIPEKGAPPVPDEMKLENDLVKLPEGSHVLAQHPGDPSVFSCPACGGVLWELQEEAGLLRYRCRVGHAFSAESMLAEQDVVMEEALWVALKTLEEKMELARRLAEQAIERGHPLAARRFTANCEEAAVRVALLRRALEGNPPSASTP